MSLASVQLELVRLLSGHTHHTNGNDRNLSRDEQKWLRNIKSSQGFGVTRDIIDWWRRARLNTSLPLTMKHLQLINEDELTERYLQQATCLTLFAAFEGQGFLQYLKRSCASAEVISLATFETELRQAHAVRKERGASNSYTSTVIFPCDPLELIGAILNETAKPADHYKPTYVKVDSSLPELWQYQVQPPPSPVVVSRSASRARSMHRQ